MHGSGSESSLAVVSGSGSVVIAVAAEGIGRGCVSGGGNSANTALAWVRHVRTQQTQNFCLMNNWQSLISLISLISL